MNMNLQIQARTEVFEIMTKDNLNNSLVATKTHVKIIFDTRGGVQSGFCCFEINFNYISSKSVISLACFLQCMV